MNTIRVLSILSPVRALTFGESGTLVAVSMEKYAHVFDKDGNLLNRVRGGDYMNDISYCCGKFAFTNEDGNLYLTDEFGKLIDKMHLGSAYSNKVLLTRDGFLACRFKCAFFDVEGNIRWCINAGGYVSGIARSGDYWYITENDWNKLLVVKDGEALTATLYGEPPNAVASCGTRLLVATRYWLHLYDLSNPEDPEEVWSVESSDENRRVAFSPDCKYMAVAKETGLFIYDLDGTLIERKQIRGANAVAWQGDRIAVGTTDGIITIFSV